MLKSSQKSHQNDLLSQKLEYIINLKNPICKLSELMPWDIFEKEFEKFYRKDFGRPAKPIRLMVALLILKQMFNESDETVVVRWTENPYWQYFSGEEYFQWQIPCNPTELTKFRHRIGEKGIEKIFEISISLHGKSAMESEVIPDTTVQEKNITFPTDAKLHLKIIDRCRKLSEKYNIRLRQSYSRTVKQLRFETRYARVPSRQKQGYRGRTKIGETEILRVHQKKKEKYSRYKWKKWFKRRAVVEAVISHLKRGNGLARNFLKGTVGDSINLMLSAAAYNFKKLLSKLAFIFRLLKITVFLLFYRSEISCCR